VVVAALLISVLVANVAWDNWALPTLKSWLAHAGAAKELERRFALVLAGILASTVVFSVALAGWFWVMSARMYRHKVFPPAGYPLLVKTAVVRGAGAVRHARVHAVAGALALGLCAYMWVALFRIFPIAATLRSIGG
jgi:hypothetical protein